METLTVTTPKHSRTPEIHTPDTPKHGFADSWEPYSPRKSARISQRNGNNTSHARTPSPRAPRVRKNYVPTSSSSSMTPSTSPQKKGMPAMDSGRGASGSNLSVEGAATAAAALGFGALNPESRIGRPGAIGLLPTPAKTPQKTPSPRTKANVNAVRRNLFHHEGPDVVPTPKRNRGKKHMLDSFDAADDDDDSFPIFTDTRERIPEVNPNEDNPFYGNSTHVPEVPRRRSKRQHVSIPGEGKITVEEAVKREDGMLIVFRGKKQFRKFADIMEDASEALDEGDGGLDAAVESGHRRPMTRSSIKPRLLFPAAKPAPVSVQQQSFTSGIEDEEAETDIEEPNSAKEEMDMEEDEPETPSDQVDQFPDTPGTPRFPPNMQATPPTTLRTTRHGTKAGEEATPMKPVGGKKRSPFDSWQRTKTAPESSSSGSTKRSGEPLASDASKRTRA